MKKILGSLCTGLLAFQAVAANAAIVISEFMADNVSVLKDEDGEYSDWIELHNTGTAAVNLEGWYLTDNAADLRQWRFPNVDVPRGGFLLVFASNKDRKLPGTNLHTNFRLQADGEYLALVEPDGVTVASALTPRFPAQLPNISYGFGTEVNVATLLSTASTARVLVPTDGSLSTTWTQAGFDDSTWPAGPASAGFDAGPDPAEDFYASLLASEAPLAWWRCSETTGLLADNSGSLGSAADAAYLNIALSAVGPRPADYGGFETNNRAARFNGFSGRVRVPDNPAFDFGTGPFSIEMWFNPANAGARGDLFTYKGAGNDFGIHVASQGANTLSLYHNGFIGTAGGISNGLWYHLIVARGAGGQVNAYLNGQPLFQGTDAGSMNIANDILIGSNHAGSPDSASTFFNGSIDEVSIHGSALSADQARSHYERGRRGGMSFTDLVGMDLLSAMRGVNSSVYLRVPFVLTNASSLDRMILRMRYDDGFAAWINGVQVAAVNAPELISWNSTATVVHADGAAVLFEDFELADFRDAIMPGTNVLVIQGLNIASDNADFLVAAELSASDVGPLSTQPRYFVLPTPGILNGIGTKDLGPILSEVSHTPALPAKPKDAEDIVVAARITPAFAPLASVTLHYQVMFGSVLSIPMTDGGLDGDALAGDGIYSAAIPAAVSSPGQMVRWYVTAADAAEKASRWPLFEDPLGSPQYLGTVIDSPAPAGDLPLFDWFAANRSAAFTPTGTRCALFSSGRFYDNVFVRLRGGATTLNSQKFDFNRGDHFFVNEEVGWVEEINMNSNGSDATYLRPPLAFETARLAGNAASHSFNMLMRHNGGADRVAVFIEQVDDEFLQRNDLDPEGALYKFVQRGTLLPVFSDITTGVEKKTRRSDDWSDLQALVNGLNLPTLAQREAYIFDHLDLPQLMNYLAIRALILDADDVRKNFYMYRDTNGDQEWKIFPWDKDWTFGVEGDGGTFLHHPFFGDQAHAKQNANQWSILWNVLYNTPSTREMYLRRLRTLMDEILQPPTTPVAERKCEQRVDRWHSNIAPALPGVAGAVTTLKNWFNSRRNDLYVTYSATNSNPANALVPLAQPTYPNIVIGTVEFNPASGDQRQEFVELVNENGFAVDISGWQLRGAVEYDFRPGVVIRAGSRLYLSPDVVAFRARTTGPRAGQSLLVQGNYRGQLSARGEPLQLLDARGRIVQSVSYAGQPSLAQQFLRVTEIMYHPPPALGTTNSPEDFEFIELRNISATEAVELAGVHFAEGILFGFSTGAVSRLLPGQRVLVVNNLEAFRARYGNLDQVAGQYQGQGIYLGRLDNGGERIRLLDAAGEEILDFSYNNAWYPITDGLGFSLVIVDELAEPDAWDSRQSWRPSGLLQGSPGATDPGPAVVPQVLITEALAHSEVPPPTDTVELHNPTPADVDVGGWFLSDNFNRPKMFRIPPNTIIPVGGYLLFDESDFNASPLDTNSFALSSTGEEVYLFSADTAGELTGHVHGFKFGPSEDGVSFGRHVNSMGQETFVAQMAPTLGASNGGPNVGPVVISEIMYHSPEQAELTENTAAEYVELHNGSTEPVPLFNPAQPASTWRLNRAVEFAFPGGTTLSPAEYVLVVGFDPVTNAPALAAFRTRYNIGAEVRIFGPYQGTLNNAGETVELEKPVWFDQAQIAYVLVEEIGFGDSFPWPAAADGVGLSLQRISLSQYGDDPANWTAAPPSPGQAFPGGASPVITTHPQSQTVLAFDDVQLSVTAQGAAPLSYQWRRNGNNLPGATRPVLQLSRIKPEEHGVYDVAVFNAAGSAVSLPATLTLFLSVEILQHPQSVSAWPGSNVTFSVSASSSTPLIYQWLKDGKPIPGATERTLSLTGVRVEDDGDYVVRVTDAIGSVLSTPARLAILVVPTIVVHPVAQTNYVGSTVTLSVEVTNTATLPIGYRWRKGTALLANRVNINSRVDVVTLNNIQLADAVNYSVIVTNQASYTPGLVSKNARLGVVAAADADGDTLPDDFELAHGLNPNDPLDAAQDADGDGVSNRDEHTAGTDPNDPLSFLKVEIGLVPGQVDLHFLARTPKTYTIEYTEDLVQGPWTKLTDVAAPEADRLVTISDPNPTQTRYYRLATPAQR